MGAKPSGNIILQASFDNAGNITLPADVEIPSGFDLCGAQIVIDGMNAFGTIDAKLVAHAAPPAATPAPAPVDVIDGGAAGLAANATTTLGGADQIIEIGHMRTLGFSVVASAGVPTDGTVTAYLSSVGSVGSQ